MFGLGIGVGVCALALIVVSAWVFVTFCRKRRAVHGVDRADVESWNREHNIILGMSDSEDVELDTIVVPESTGKQPRFTDSADAIVDAYDESMMRGISLDAKTETRAPSIARKKKHSRRSSASSSSPPSIAKGPTQ